MSPTCVPVRAGCTWQQSSIWYRMVIGWQMAEHMHTSLVSDALQAAADSGRPKPDIRLRSAGAGPAMTTPSRRPGWRCSKTRCTTVTGSPPEPPRGYGLKLVRSMELRDDVKPSRLRRISHCWALGSADGSGSAKTQSGASHSWGQPLKPNRTFESIGGHLLKSVGSCGNDRVACVLDTVTTARQGI